jgi:hypothetical protein
VPHPALSRRAAKPQRRGRRIALACALALLALSAAGANAALVETGETILRADGGFQPRTLPRGHYAPIGFKGFFDIARKGGGRPDALNQVVIDFDRDGRLDPAGLPTCPLEAVVQANTEEARAHCQGAIVGQGQLGAVVVAGSSTYQAQAPLTIFNGVPQEGRPTVILHAQTTSPATQTFAIVVPIERRRGAFRYRATVNVPPIFGGNGSLTHLELEVGRRFRAGGKARSYVSARCSDSVLETRGRFTFASGLLIEGAVAKFCRAK